MSIWGWHSPIAWAIFLVAIGVTVYLLSLSLRVLSETGVIASSIPQKRR